MNTTHPRLSAHRTKLPFIFALPLLLTVGIASAEPSIERNVESERAHPTVAEQTAFKRVDAQSNIEMRLATSLRTPTQPADSKAKRVLKKIVKPIEATWAELRHPREIVKFAQRLFRLDAPTATLADNFAEGPLSYRALTVAITSAPEYSMTSVMPLGTGRPSGMSLNSYFEAPTPNETFESTMSRHTTTQLQVRMRTDWALFYEFNRTSSAIYRDDVGVGVGLKHTF